MVEATKKAIVEGAIAQALDESLIIPESIQNHNDHATDSDQSQLWTSIIDHRWVVTFVQPPPAEADG